jgi:ribosomal protein L11 methyltransferase
MRGLVRIKLSTRTRMPQFDAVTASTGSCGCCADPTPFVILARGCRRPKNKVKTVGLLAKKSTEPHSHPARRRHLLFVRPCPLDIAMSLTPARAIPYSIAERSRVGSLSVPHRKPRTYTRVIFEAPHATADDAAAILVAHGALGCELVRPSTPAHRGMNPRARRRDIRIVAWFDRTTPATIARLTRMLSAASMISKAPLDGSPPDQLEDPGWATTWRKRFAPLPIGNRFLIVPPWRGATDRDRIAIVIRPGQAFGTGHHPSTAGTLALVEDVCSKRDIARALDVGAGSGILSIAMRKLGVPEIVAIDADPTALANARENAELNHINHGLRISAVPLSSIRGHFDLIVANILSSVLIAMAPRLKVRLRSGGRLILAGILTREARAVTAAFRPELRRLRSRTDGAWTALLLAK